MTLSYNIVQNSTYLDAFGAVDVGPNAIPIQQLAQNTSNNLQTAQQVIGPLIDYPGSSATLTQAADTVMINVGLMVERAATPATLESFLAMSWADRQTYVESQGDNIWSTFGAHPHTYNHAHDAILEALGIPAGSADTPMQLAAHAGYIGNVENRTIWMTLTADQFNTLFHSVLLTTEDGEIAWTGPLSLPSTIPLAHVAGLWVENGIEFRDPVLAAGVPPDPPKPAAGPVSLGNWATITSDQIWASTIQAQDYSVHALPQAIAANYNFPLAVSPSKEAIALVETGLDQSNLLSSLNTYRGIIGVSPLLSSQFILKGATAVAAGSLGEMSLDISVLSGVAPNSPQILYGAAAASGDPYVSSFQSYQNAFFDFADDPEVLSSSFFTFFSMTAQSPFQAAWQQLFIDGLLSGVSVHIAAADVGSSGFHANGTANAVAGSSPAYGLSVGGTSVAASYAAAGDATLDQIYDSAIQNDLPTLSALVAAGLTTLPSKLPTTNPNTLINGASKPYSAVLSGLIESVWNQYVFVPTSLTVPPADQVLQVEFGVNQTGSGAVDPTQPTPSYQVDFGLAPGSNPASPSFSGRGAPDVSALAGGDASYMALNSDYVIGDSTYSLVATGGTSAAAPLWATLTSQFNYIFQDQKLPTLGFYNDLLYTAAAVAPGSFNDITLGNNNSGYFFSATSTGVVQESSGEAIESTGLGQNAQAGYDLASGLGTPNGLLLARALTQIAHTQMDPHPQPEVLVANAAGGWQAGATESLLFQASATSAATIELSTGGTSTSFSSGVSSPYAWTSRLAEQSLQSDFDSALVTLFDRFAQGTLVQAQVASGAEVDVAINGTTAQTPQSTLTAPFGFVDFTTSPLSTGFSPDLRVALPVAIAEMAGSSGEHVAHDDVAIVRLRQNGTDSLSISLFRVDDYAGTIDQGGVQVHPGDPGYAAAAGHRVYHTTTGATVINGPGWGNFKQVELANVHTHDIIAMTVTDNTTLQTYWSFANSNETVNGQHVAHLWNYGLNTWGFEDTYGGGDRDFNDMVIGIDFTSASGQALIAGS